MYRLDTKYILVVCFYMDSRLGCTAERVRRGWLSGTANEVEVWLDRITRLLVTKSKMKHRWIIGSGLVAG